MYNWRSKTFLTVMSTFDGQICAFTTFRAKCDKFELGYQSFQVLSGVKFTGSPFSLMCPCVCLSVCMHACVRVWSSQMLHFEIYMTGNRISLGKSL